MKVSRQDTVETNGKVKEDVVEIVVLPAEVFLHHTNECVHASSQLV